MRLFDIKKIAFTSALVAGSVFYTSASAQVTTIYSGAPGALSGTGGNQSISSVSLSSAQTINFTLTGLYSGAGGSPNFTLQLRNGSTGVGNLVQILTTSSSTYTGSFNATGPANSLWFIANSPLNYNISNLVLTYGVAPTPSGPTAEEIAAALAAAQAAILRSSTQQSVVNTAQALQGTYALQNSVLANSFTYDCTLFDKNNICVSGGARNTAVQAANGLNNTSALLIAAYRPIASVRIGAYADQNLSVNNGGSTVNLGNNTPLIGLFAAWNQRQDDTGTEVRGSIAYGQKDTTINRQVVGTSQAGTGSSTLISQGAQLTAKYGFGLGQAFVVSPYAGVRYSQNNMGGYTEGTSAGVTAPLTFGAVNTNATTLLAGVGGSFRGIPKTNLFASAGIESDTNTAAGTVNGTSSTITGLTPVNFNANPVKNRPTATVGATYDVEKNQRLGVTGIYRQEAYQAVSTTTVMATYTVGF